MRQHPTPAASSQGAKMRRCTPCKEFLPFFVRGEEGVVIAGPSAASIAHVFTNVGGGVSAMRLRRSRTRIGNPRKRPKSVSKYTELRKAALDWAPAGRAMGGTRAAGGGQAAGVAPGKTGAVGGSARRSYCIGWKHQIPRVISSSIWAKSSLESGTGMFT
jgi:hypothetical protein